MQKWLSLLGIVGVAAGATAAPVELKKGDSLCIIGNALAERMQHDGWLETLIHSRFAEHELRFRNLGFSGDEVVTRLRSDDFGTPDEHLTFHKADVIFAFFGFNESFAGEAGLEQFRKDLDGFIKHTLTQRYNGTSAPRLVLFAPIAHENVGSPDLPDGQANNRRLALYTKAMSETAKARGVAFVDLCAISQELYAKAQTPLTINGIHLSEAGNRLLAEQIDQALFGERVGPIDRAQLERIRQAVLDKNFYWYHRYRTTDGYNVYGGRSHLKFVDDITNRDGLQREMQVLDAMTANRDRRIWAVAQSSDLVVDDGNTPPFIPVKTNKPGPGPKGAHLFLGGEEAIGPMTVAKGMKINLYASEETFPELVNPVQMAWDTKGRLWVCAWPSYPHWKPKEPMNDKLLILEDTNGDGKADKCKTFADDLHNPTGFEFYGGGVIVAMAPDLLFLKDTDGDDKADWREHILHGIDSADTHHTANSFVLSPGGALHFQEGVFHKSQIESPYGVLRNPNACVWRYEPRTWRVERYVPYDFANPHGHVFDYWGQDFVTDGTGANPYHGTLFSGHLDYPHKHDRAPQLYQQRTRPCPATEILSSRHFPPENQGNLLVANVIGFLGILQYRFEDKGSSFVGLEVEPIVSSTDQNFRPADIEIGPDGAIYFTDWCNPIIGHMQHHLRDPSRDKTHGRVYRVTYPSRPLLEPAKIAGEPIEKLLDLLKEHEDRVRYRARIELSGRETKVVMAALERWVAGLDPKDPNYQHHLLEGLWLHEYHNVVDLPLLERMLSSPEFRARAAATRVLCSWRDRVPDGLALLRKLAADPHPRVRLEAVRAASFYKAPEAIEIPLISTEHPTDLYLDYTRGETMKALEPYWKAALASGKTIDVRSEAAARFLIRNISTDDLVKMKRSAPVYREMLFRSGVRDEHRQEALRGLARLEKKPELRFLLDAIANLDEKQQDESAVFDLARLLTGRSPAELAEVRGELEQLATAGKLAIVRQIGFVALIAADGKIDKAWKLANTSVERLADLVTAMPLITDPTVRAELYPKVLPLLDGLPKHLAPARKSKGTYGRFVRIELKGQRTLTLAEVEVMSDGRNVARQGKASQKNTAHGGEARRAIDGNKSGLFGVGGQTHTQENTTDPWWEVDLGADLPIESIVVYNRREGNLGKRLNNFTMLLLDGARNEVWAQKKVPAPDASVSFTLDGGGPEGLVRRSAMRAITFVRGREPETFVNLARMVRQNVDRINAVRAIQRVPQAYWASEEAAPLLESTLAWLRTVPADDRRAPAVLEALEFGDALASRLPADQARKFRALLGELGVQVVRIGTLPHQMAYDKERIVVRAGRQVDFVFDNTDLMPHNFVIAVPGALEEIGQLAEATASQPGAAERHYVPQSNKILLASRLVQPREVETLTFTAPTKPGVYPFVCTYPGHWRRMFGALYVVEDLEEYRADPQGYLASHPLPILDELLKFARPRTQWKFDDLASAVGSLEHRSFGNAKQIFQIAGCVSCHRLNEVGNPFGPELAKLDTTWKPADILREVLDPSLKINENYQTHIFELDSGAIVSGLVLEEKGETIKVIENPLVKAQPIEIKRAEIVQRQKSPMSIMPKGLLDNLTREEILDLIAYVAARGDQNAKYFHHHGH